MQTDILAPQAAIWHSLNHYAYGDATFLAERLYTELPTDEALHLLATCYFRWVILAWTNANLPTNSDQSLTDSGRTA